MEFPVGSATGVGSLPGADPLEACRLVFGELPDLPHIPELPNRGAGADMIGRTAVFLVDLAVDLQPSGWRLVPRAGMDLRRARSFLARDLDALEEIADGYTGLLKLQATGPWTMAASVELNRGDKALADSGAVRDLRESLTEGLRQHVAEVRRRVPGAEVVVQLDEPSLPAVVAGRVKTASGFDVLPAVETREAQDALAAVIDALDTPVIGHCCAAEAPIGLFRGAAAVSLDATLLPPDDLLGEAVEAGTALILGVVPGTDADLSSLRSGARGGEPMSTVDSTADIARKLWNRLGFKPESLAQQVILSPACGLAGASPGYVRQALELCREAGKRMAAEPEPS